MRRTFSRIVCLGFALALLVGSMGCSRENPDKNLDASGSQVSRVVLMLNWYPEAEHGGFYAAQVHGIFQKYGLDVEIRPGGPSAPVAQELLTGRVQFAVGNADDVLLFRQESAAIVALLAPIQNTPRCVLVHADSSATDLTRLSGLTLQANVGRPFLNFLQWKGYLKDVRVVPYSGGVANFVADKNTAIQAYSFSEPYLAKQSGAQVRTLMLSEIEFNPYASCLLATETTISDQPELVSKMVAACREGWIRYLEGPNETNSEILKHNQHGMTLDALEFGAQEIRTLCLPEGMESLQLGEMSLQRWTTLVDQFVELDLINGENVRPQSVFNDRFLMQKQPE